MKKAELVLLTVAELKAMAKEKGVKGYSKLRKIEIIEAIIEHEEIQNKEKEEKQNFIALLEQSNNTVYTEITHVSTSGMMRAVKTYIKNDYGTQDITEKTQKYTGGSYHSSGGLKVVGAGFDVRFEIVYHLSLALFGNDDRGGYKLNCATLYEILN